MTQTVLPVAEAGGTLLLAVVILGMVAATFGAALETALASGYTREREDHERLRHGVFGHRLGGFASGHPADDHHRSRSMTAPKGVLDARLHLLDRQILDEDGKPVSTVADLDSPTCRTKRG